MLAVPVPASTDDLKSRVVQVLTEEVRPTLQIDGGDIELIGISESVVQVRLAGACGSCPSTILAVIMGIEQELRKRVPEGGYLEAVP